jgi:sodium-dependent dicarboxylate transporter 2/3/5
MDGEKTASAYINSIIFLFLGGFMLALAMEQWDLHKRIALKIITLFGGSTNSIIVGFMVSGAFLSMWISNTATAIMMLPIGLAIMNKIENEFGVEKTKNFSISLMLTIAYASSIGGISTLIGTPTNLAFLRIYGIIFPEAPPIGFGTWMLVAVPIAVVLAIASLFLMLKIFYRLDRKLRIEPEFIKEEYRKLGKISYEEKVVGLVFAFTAFLWIFRADLNLEFIVIPGWQNLLSFPKFINDGVVSITMALTLFFIPAKYKPNTTLLDASVFSKIPWGIILLFGGGFALAEGFTSTGLSHFIGSRLEGITEYSPVLIVAATALLVAFLTELTSNTATVQMILPIIASVSIAARINPLLLMITATLAASMAFMLPVATPPNAIIFASNRLKIIDMFKTGLGLNLLAVVIITLFVYLIGSLLFNLNEYPGWAKIKP